MLSKRGHTLTVVKNLSERLQHAARWFTLILGVGLDNKQLAFPTRGRMGHLSSSWIVFAVNSISPPIRHWPQGKEDGNQYNMAEMGGDKFFERVAPTNFLNLVSGLAMPLIPSFKGMKISSNL